jgi:glycosyltransferase involved in cell wall biosynthesis
MITGRADFGGGPEHVYQLSKALARSCAVYIACPREEPYWSRYEALVGPERMLEIPHRKVSLRAFQRMARFIRANGIDIVHAHGRAAGIYGRPAAAVAGARCFYTPHGGTPVIDAKTFLYASVEYVLSMLTRGVIAVSGTEAEALRALCPVRSRLSVIQNGVEIPSRLESPDTRLNGPLKVVHVTRFVFQKNSEMLIEVLSALRDLGELERFEFTILGDGPGRADFAAALASRGLSQWVKLPGAVTNPGAYLSAAFCLVSTSRWEGLPIALLEGMARGVPAIATDVIGNKDAVIDHETGFLYDIAAPEMAAQRLAQLAHYPMLWKQMVRAARERAEKEFSVQSMAEAVLRLYTRSMSRGGRARVVRAGVIPSSAGHSVPAGSGAVQGSR